MRIRIISDGAYGTKVVDAETGEMIEDVVAVNWSIATPTAGGDHTATAVITFWNVPAEVEAEADITTKQKEA